jgi:hypothetical protein
MPRAVPIHYDGRTFPSQIGAGQHVAKITGRSRQICQSWLRQFNNDVQKAIEYAGTVRPKSITYEGRVYNQKDLAAHLAEITGRPRNSCRNWLQEFGNDAAKVIEYARTAPVRPQKTSVSIGGRTFPSHTAFGRYVQTNYGLAAQTVSVWLSTGRTPEQCLQRARAYRKRHRKPRQFSGEVVLFGWHFRSPFSLCTYYKIPYARFIAEWRARAPGTPVHNIPACMQALARLWEAGRLDERNRHPPEVEARLPKSCLPTNATLDKTALTAYEHRQLDCLQPEDVMTERRHGLAWLAKMRQRTAS